MRKTKGLIFILAAAVIGLAATSCAKENNTLRYNNATMGNIVNGVFMSDQGNIFNVTEQTCEGRLDTMKRAFIICDVLQNTADKEKEYDIRLNYIGRVLTKDAIAKSEIADLETYMNDPIVLIDFWFSGGYANMYLMVPVKRNDGKSHEINLLHEKKENGYKFIVRHDAAGEILKEDGSNSDLIFAYAYASFPISSIISEDTAKVEIEWNSYSVSGSIVTAKTKILTADDEYKKSAYEQVPPTAYSNTLSYSLE